MKVLLHACCADCTIKFLESEKKNDFVVDIFYYNPNIQPRSEYQSRLKAMQLIADKYKVKLIIPDWQPSDYFKKIQSKTYKFRCIDCWNLRIEKSIGYAKNGGYDQFSTTLLSSEYQDSETINKIVEKYASENNISIFRAEIDKKINTSGFYKQNFCGCVYSLNERMEGKYLPKLIYKKYDDKRKKKVYELVLDNKAIGTVGLRDKTTKAGDIVYKILPEHRNRGYGNIILREILKETKKTGRTEVKLVCRESNLASKKIIENNNGKLIAEQNRKGKEKRLVYSIRL